MELATEREARLKAVNAKTEQEYEAKISIINDAFKASLSPAGALGLPPLLDERRMKHCIPDGAFEIRAAFSTVLIAQLPSEEGNYYQGTSIIKPDAIKVKEREQTSRGILVSAGLVALDTLRSNGIDLGHIVHFRRLQPWRQLVATISGFPYYLVEAYDGDIKASEDIVGWLRDGRVTEECGDDGRHFFKDAATGEIWKPIKPKRTDDI